MATVREIAEKCGVSVGTVDRVLHNRGRVNEKTRQRILDTAKVLDYKPNRVAQGLAVRKKRLRIAFFAIEAQSHPFFADVNAAARKKAAELADFAVEVVFIRVSLSINALGEFRPCVFMPDSISLADFDGFITPGTMQYENFAPLPKEKPIVYYNDIGDGECLAYVGSNYEKAGRIAAELCALSADEHKEIAILDEDNGDTSSPSFRKRMKGFFESMKSEHSDFNILNTYHFQNDYSIEFERTKAFLKAYPNVSVAYVVNPGNYDICRAIHDADVEKKIRIITNDLGEAQKMLMRTGAISAAITQEPDAQGAKSLDILFEYLAYGRTPEKIHFTDLGIHVFGNSD